MWFLLQSVVGPMTAVGLVVVLVVPSPCFGTDCFVGKSCTYRPSCVDFGLDDPSPIVLLP